MTEPKKSAGQTVSFRASAQDLEIIVGLQKKLGLARTAILKLALRRLWRAEEKQ